MKLKKYTPAIISFLIFWLNPANINSCGFFVTDEEYRFWAFDPNITGGNAMRPFFYTSELYYEGVYQPWTPDMQEFPPKPDYDENVRLWMGKTSGQAAPEDINVVLNETEPVDYFHLREGLIHENSFMKFLNARPDYLKYMDFAKKVEFESNYSANWNCPDCPRINPDGKKIRADRYNNYFQEESGTFGNNSQPTLASEGEKLLEAEKDEFLRLRYAFQLIRLSYYRLDTNTVQKLYSDFFEKRCAAAWLKNTAMFYDALSRPVAERNLKLAQVFEQCPEKRFRCVQLYLPESFSESMKLAVSNHDKAMLTVMQINHDPRPELNVLDEIYKLDPANRFLPFLWVREINKLEDWILGPKYTSFGSTRSYYNSYFDSEAYAQRKKQEALDVKYAYQCKESLQRIASDNQNSNNAIYHLFAGYASFIVCEFADAEKHYSLAAAGKLNSLAASQLSLCRLMLDLSVSTAVSDQTCARIAEAVKNLDRASKFIPEKKVIRNQLVSFAAQELIKRGRRIEGLMLFGHTAKAYNYHPLIGLSNVYTQLFNLAEPQEMDEIIAMIKKEKKSEFEQYLCSPVYEYNYESEDQIKPWDVNRLYDLQSMLYIRKDNLEKALNAVQHIDTSYWSNEVNSMFKRDDPFTLNPWNGHSAVNYKNKSYNKVTFLRELIALKQKAYRANGEEKARLLYLIGNAYYSMTYYGKYWYMQSNYISVSMEEDEVLKNNLRDFMEAGRSAYYFREALKLTRDEKLATLCAATMALAYPADEQQDKDKQVKEWLYRKGMNTDTYDQISGNCEIFYDILKTYY